MCHSWRGPYRLVDHLEPFVKRLTASGLIALAAARASGAHPIVITDVEPKRLQFAKEFMPACSTYQVSKELDAEGNAKEIRRLFGATEGKEYYAPTTVLECTGVESSVCTAAYVVRRGGTVMVIGVGRSFMNNLPFMHLSLAEVSSRITNTVPSNAHGLADPASIH